MYIHITSHPPFRPPRSRRVLYVGKDHALTHFLNDSLPDCDVVRAPAEIVARIFIKGQIRYSLLLFDAELPDSTGLRLAALARSQKHRRHTPITILSQGEKGSAGAGVFFESPDDYGRLAGAIERLLTKA